MEHSGGGAGKGCALPDFPISGPCDPDVGCGSIPSMLEAGTSIELRESAAKRNGVERKYKMTESGGETSILSAPESRARAVVEPEATKASIKAATLATLETMLGPEYELSDKIRLDACALGAKVSGLVSDAPVVVVQTVAMAFGKLGGAVEGE